MNTRVPAALLLSGLLTVAAYSQPPQDQAKTPEKPKISWPSEVEGKDVHEWLKILSDRTNDPVLRAQAVTALSQLSPFDVRKLGSKHLLAKIRPGGELDSSVRLAIIDLVGGLGFDDAAENKDATLYLQQSATSGQSVLRLHALMALARFGHKAHDQAEVLANDIVSDSSYDIRHMLAYTLGQIAGDEIKGSNERALRALLVLSGGAPNSSASHERCAMVRLEALQSLVRLGPAFEKGFVFNPKANPPQLPKYNETLKNDVINKMKLRINETKSVAEDHKEHDRQLALWCRLVIFRFCIGDEKEMVAQVKGIAQALDPSAKEDIATRVQSLQLLAMLTEAIVKDKELSKDLAPIVDKVAATLQNTTDKKEIAVRVAALHTLGAFGEKVASVVIPYVVNAKEELAVRIAAINALALMGEKGASALPALLEIVNKRIDFKDSDEMALLTNAIAAVAAMGVKSKDAIGNLEDLKVRVREAKATRVKSPEYLKMLNSIEFQKFLAKLTKEQREKILSNQDSPEDQFENTIQEAIRYIRESAPGRPGPAPPEPKK